MFTTQINAQSLQEGQYVVVKVIKMEDNIVTVEALEYPGIKGLIMPNELSRKRIKNAIQATKVGKTEVCQVLKIENSNYDFSLKQVDEQSKTNVLNEFKQNKLAYRIAEKVSKATNVTIEDIYSHFSKEIEAHRSFFNFLSAIRDNLALLNNSNIVEDNLYNVIKHQFKASSFKIRADIDINCYKYNGLEIIKNALQKGQDLDSSVEICLLNTPTFSITKTCSDKDQGFEAVKKIIECIKKSIEEKGGVFHLMAEPRLYGEKNKHNLLKSNLEESMLTSSSDSE
ncbi:EIF2S1 [Ecytonucleospora hepatopenaei]|uniref:eIF2S1 n=1 Tax=Ecytonucleospora hepatopenaei TaxID=646526 RepID=A0A1W0E8G9_9MICR|nr:EIF2S1 [Ecytonucleospora hepatopenaei]